MTETIEIPATWFRTGFPSVDAEPKALPVTCGWCGRWVGAVWVWPDGSAEAQTAGWSPRRTFRCCGMAATLTATPLPPVARTQANDPPREG